MNAINTNGNVEIITGTSGAQYAPMDFTPYPHTATATATTPCCCRDFLHNPTHTTGYRCTDQHPAHAVSLGHHLSAASHAAHAQH
jgi:hypothetical protein